MKHISALLIKFVMVAVILWIILGSVTNLAIGEVLYVSLAVTIIAYIIGDLLVLPASSNAVATIVDFVIALFTIYAFNYIWRSMRISFTTALIAAVVLGIGEWFLHKYIAKNVFPNREAK